MQVYQLKEKNKRTRVGILADAFMGWGGGIDFLSYIVNALMEDDSKDLYILFSRNGKPVEFTIDTAEQLKDLKKISVTDFKGYFNKANVDIEIRRKDFVKSLNYNVKVRYFSHSPTLFYRLLNKNGIEVLLPCMTSLGKLFPIPWVGYIWDLQHKYLPAYFDTENINHRDNVFTKTLLDAPAIIVNAKTIKKDLIKFYKINGYSEKIIALPFCPYPKKEWLNKLDKNIDKYDLPDKYFIVSNQFWKHKDHITAIKALWFLDKNYGIKANLVATGDMNDERDKEYIKNIKNEIDRLKMSDRFFSVGYIPKIDQIALIKRAQALIQPTLYEGGPGGGATYNAIALGKQVFLSDIEINKEISSPLVTFFKAGSYKSLAEKIANTEVKKESLYKGNNLKSLTNKLNLVIERAMS